MPAGTVGSTLTAPVSASSEMPPGHAPEGATVALPPVPSVAGAPLTWSLAATLAIGVPAVPAGNGPGALSTAGAMLALTCSVAWAVAHSGCGKVSVRQIR